jgi:hypothetical protein
MRTLRPILFALIAAPTSGMRPLAKKLLPLTVFAIAATSLFCAQPARAFTVTINQVGANVVANGSGAFNLTGLTQELPGQLLFAEITAQSGRLSFSQGNITRYTGLTGPTSFGTGLALSANTSSGDAVAIRGFLGLLILPQGYVSNTALSNSDTWNNATFASMGLTPGTYVWTWGDGPNQNFTLIIGGAGVPDGGTTVSLLGCALLGLAGLRRRLGC